nr:MAG TPA: hypothetical protein [Caudoviricetes sp.]
MRADIRMTTYSLYLPIPTMGIGRLRLCLLCVAH